MFTETTDRSPVTVRPSTRDPQSDQVDSPVPAKQLLRWQDDGGAVPPSIDVT